MPGPTISISPAPGAVSRSQTITVEITDPGAVLFELIRCAVPAVQNEYAVAFQSGAAPALQVGSNFAVTTTAIANGYRYEITHAAGGWLGDFTIKADARNGTDASTSTVAYTAADPYVPLALVPFANPPVGTIAPDATIEIDIESDSSFSSLYIFAVYADEFAQPVSADLAVITVFGVVPLPPYTAIQSNPTPEITRIVLGNSNGWPAGLFQIYVAASVDGNSQFILPDAILDGGAYTSTAQPPGVSIVSPPVGEAITASTPIVFDVVDDSGAFRRVIVAVYNPTTGLTVIVHDGDSFLGGFALASTRTMIAGGFRFAVVPDSGWTASPTLRVFAIDRSGEEV
jgi:hypothetical protein